MAAGVGARSAEAEAHHPYGLSAGGDHSAFEHCNHSTLQQCLFDRRAEGGACYANPCPALVAPRRAYRP